MSDLIISHLGADFDSLAAMVAARKLYPKAVPVFSGGVDRNVREFLSLFADQLDIRHPRDIDLDRVARLIVVDTVHPRRLGDFAKLLERPGISVHLYDHHPPTEVGIRADLVVVEAVGATTTILVRKLRENGLKISPFEATLFALGIYEETGSLTFSNTTVEDVTTVAYLLEEGANLQMVASYINRSLTEEQRKLLNDLILNTEYHSLQGVRIAIARASCQGYVDEIALLAHKLCDIENVGALFALIQSGGTVFVVGRSKLDAVDVGRILEQIGGGGHHRAASASLKSRKVEEVRAQLLELLKHAVRPLPCAADFMSHPVRTITPDTTVEKASKIMLRYGYGGLTVVEDGKVVGVISRRDIDKALGHRLRAAPVKSCMVSKVPIASPDTSLFELEPMILGSEARRVPVVDADQKIVGIVTSTDLLHAMYGYSWSRPRMVYSSLSDSEANLAELLKERLPESSFELLRSVGERGQAIGMSVFLVGGSVRDLLLKEPTFDFDLLVEGDAVQLAKSLQSARGGRVIAHARFGTAVWTLPDDRKVDLATARTEYYEYPAALPQVEHSSVREDLYRRDFSINAMAIHLSPDEFGRLLDFFGGRRDLEQGVVRVLHNLSFVEDPTRAFRAVRFEQRYGMRMDAQTEDLIAHAVETELFGRLTSERIRDELILILSEPDPIPAIHRVAHLDMLKYVHARLAFDEKVLDELTRARKELEWFMSVKPEDGHRVLRWVVFLLPLLRDMTISAMKTLCRKLALTKEPTHVLITIAEAGDALTSTLARPELSNPSALRKLLLPMPVEALILLLARTTGEMAEKRIRLYLTQLKDAHADITGDDLIALGFRPNPRFRAALDAALDAKLDGEAPTKEEQLAVARGVLA